MGPVLHLDGVAQEIEIVARQPYLRRRVNGRVYEVTAAGGADDGVHRLEIDGLRHDFTRVQVGDRQYLRMGGRSFEASLTDPRDATRASGATLDGVRAPMPCGVIEVYKQPDDAVARGEILVTVESMKWRIALVAPRDGRLARAPQRAGETFEKDALVAELEPLDGV